jgi:cold shock CspA family protein/ribosome-associated translation inhibitor RaiA
MILPVQITARRCTLSPAEEATIRQEASSLDTFADRIVSCRVVVETPHRRHRTGSRFALRIDIGLPQGEAVVTRRADDNFLTAVQEAFTAARRQIQDHARVLRGDVKRPEQPETATVAKLFPWEGYGFLELGTGEEIYFHRNAVVNDGFDKLEVGTQCRYVESTGDKGPQASTVSPIWRTVPAPAQPLEWRGASGT